MNWKRWMHAWRKVSSVFVLLMLFSPLHAVQAEKDAGTQKLEAIAQFIEEQMPVSAIPGLALVIVHKGNTIYEQGFGYADLDKRKPVTGKTLFELGSTSKAFTGLAVLQLEKKGLLKRTDVVTTYLPWLQMTYNGQPATITLNHLLHHTSGIPFTSIGTIPPSEAEDALEQTVRTLLKHSLNREPGSRFEYATINYDVLGLIIEKVSGQRFEDYMQDAVLDPLGMVATVTAALPVQSTELATSYKIAFAKPQAYAPPVYRGNTPAGYIVSNAQDIAQWLKVQLGVSSTSRFDPSLITASHVPDRTVSPDEDGSYYASGWSVYEAEKDEISHGGNNPAFSSFIATRPDEQLGIAVLTNINSEHAAYIGQAVMDIWAGKQVVVKQSEGYKTVDQAAVWLIRLWGCLCLALLFLIGKLFSNIRRKRRNWSFFTTRQCLLFSLNVLIVMIIVAICVVLLNSTFRGLPWSFIQVWSPSTLKWASYGFIVPVNMYLIYAFMLVFSKKTGQRSVEASGTVEA